MPVYIDFDFDFYNLSIQRQPILSYEKKCILGVFYFSYLNHIIVRSVYSYILIRVVATASTSTVLKFSLFRLPVFCAVNRSCILAATETIPLSKRTAL